MQHGELKQIIQALSAIEEAPNKELKRWHYNFLDRVCCIDDTPSAVIPSDVET